jgi:serpin B
VEVVAMRRPGTILLLGVLGLALLLSGCGRSAAAAILPAKPGKAAQAVSPALMHGQETFGFTLYQQLRQAKQGENLIISPASIAMILELTMDGARGETRAAMAKALAVGTVTPDALRQGNADLRSILAAPDPKVTLTVANSVWYDKAYVLNRDFAQTAANSYGAEIRAFDGNAVPLVNQWVEKATKKRIKNLLSPGDQGQLYLVNAVYFLGEWSEPFTKEATRDAAFTLLSGTAKQVSMMQQHDRMDYLETDQFQAVRLPYGKDEHVAMYLFLPARGSSLAAFEQSLTADGWDQWMSSFQQREGTLELPKVKTESAADLNDGLIALGMGPAFERSADFTGLFADQTPAYISKVKHKTFLAIDEKGTEAAAATAVVMETGAAPPQGQPFSMIIDRPFFLAIRDDRSGALLFMGGIVEP